MLVTKKVMIHIQISHYIMSVLLSPEKNFWQKLPFQMGTSLPITISRYTQCKAWYPVATREGTDFFQHDQSNEMWGRYHLKELFIPKFFTLIFLAQNLFIYFCHSSLTHSLPDCHIHHGELRNVDTPTAYFEMFILSIFGCPGDNLTLAESNGFFLQLLTSDSFKKYF